MLISEYTLDIKVVGWVETCRKTISDNIEFLFQSDVIYFFIPWREWFPNVQGENDRTCFTSAEWSIATGKYDIREGEWLIHFGTGHGCIVILDVMDSTLWKS